MDFVAPDLDFVAAGLDFGVSGLDFGVPGLETHGCIVVRASPTGNAWRRSASSPEAPDYARRQRGNRRGEERDDGSPFYFGASR